ncbi:Magnesium transporter mgtE [Chromobacterium violaceum]|uniref:Magnesium transporter mgtE n=1 Tax=Chromobacterium violaceum TaxID=536 RepID=A0A447TIQ7_CHRVL|nr:Magnesium transporter mgtE [Chromobacterium violaceum]
MALAALMPIVAGIGGNSGNQTITMIVRALAMGQMQLGQAGRLWRKELGVSVINGMVWAASSARWRGCCTAACRWAW